MSQAGKIRVFTGDGKGKTTAAMGLAWQATSRGAKVLVVQFLKASESSGEQFMASNLPYGLTIKAMGRKGIIGRPRCSPEDLKMAEQAFQECLSAVLNRDYDIVIMDEINVAVHRGLIDVQKILKLMASKPEEVELVLTGRYAHPDVLMQADHIIEMKKIKHHFDKGIMAREGIEY